VLLTYLCFYQNNYCEGIGVAVLCSFLWRQNSVGRPSQQPCCDRDKQPGVPVRNTSGADIVSTRSADLWYLACCFTMKGRGTEFPLSSSFNVSRPINFAFIEVLTETQNVVQSLCDCVKNGV